ncbi:response regulator transcription factor [Leuconostoc litchii]|uniref:Response regulator transcription factor n=1 Tax=Leuconostoc litchii TaxID=1981069 RepID=A0A6P2CP13_9LACO|nr:response regulator transcription factor [Leuconostoc litchii]TYC47123.1 response regulator transcription factor [Leuconostoc litchii]
MKYKIFIVEDNQEIVNLLMKGLTGWGLIADKCNKLNCVNQEIENYSPHLIIMDINLPYYNGFYWTQKIRQKSSVPIIFLSSRNEETDMIMAMNFGADDYITKPFNIDLLIVKINALLRREYSFGSEKTVLSFQNYKLSVVDDLILYENQQIILSKNEMKLLYLLFQHPGQVVNKEDIMAALWDDEIFVDRNTLSVTLARLRNKLTDIGFAQYLQTVKGKGIMLNG